MKALGVAIVFEKENIDTSSGDGELMLSILASFAQAESLSVSENCKWRIRKDFAEGKTMNLALLYGYRSVGGKIEIVPEEAEVVRRAFAAYLSGIGTPTIAAMLRREHVPTRMGGDWYDTETSSATSAAQTETRLSMRRRPESCGRFMGCFWMDRPRRALRPH